MEKAVLTLGELDPKLNSNFDPGFFLYLKYSDMSA